MTDSERQDRNIRFFGVDGQERLGRARVAIVGLGGLGTHVAQQLALLGVRRLGFIEPEELAETNRNRYVSARAGDSVPGTWKTDIGQRLVHDIDPGIVVEIVREPLISRAAFDMVMGSDYVFGCLDNDGSRLVLTELCSAYAKPYIDLASDIAPDASTYGGRVVTAWDGHGCAICYEQLDLAGAQADLASLSERKDRAALYGVPLDALREVGPSVVSINGVVASLAVTEFMLAVSGVREVRRLLIYRAHMGGVTVWAEPPKPDCYYCAGIRGMGGQAGVERYLS